MQAGRLNQRVTIERYTSVRDEAGQPIETWATLATVWAAVEPLSGREFIAAQAERSDVTTRIRMRYRAGLTSADRIDHEGSQYNITGIINPRFGDTELVLMCKAA